MNNKDDDNVISFRTAAPSAQMKKLEWSDKRSRCDHRQIEVWPKEPIIECVACGVVVDPYAWIRDRCRDWERVMDNVKYKKNAAEQEMKEILGKLRALRKEYASEAEKRSAERAVMILPAQKHVRTEE